MKEKVIWIVVVLAAVGLFLNYRDTQGLKKILKEREAKAEAKVAELEKVNVKLYADNTEREKKIAQYSVVIEGLRTDIQKANKKTAEVVARLQTAPPDELLAETRRILATDQVWLRPAGAEFSLLAFRDNTGKLIEWENFSLVVVPKLVAETEWKARKIDEQADEISNFKIIDAGRIQQLEAVRGIVTDLKEYIKIENRKGLVNTLIKVGAGILIGYAIGR